MPSLCLIHEILDLEVVHESPVVMVLVLCKGNSLILCKFPELRL